jgi:hypothetical protein
MGNCFSNTSTDPSSPPPTGPVPQQPQSNGQAFELQPGPPLSVSPRGPDATLVLTHPVQPDESTLAPIPSQLDKETPQNPPLRLGRSNVAPYPRHLSRSASVYDDAKTGHWPVSEGETSHESRESNPSFPLQRSVSVDTPHNSARYGASPSPGAAPPSSFKGRGHRDQNGVGTAAVPRVGASRGNRTGSLPSTVREVLPDGFRYALRP